MRGEYSARRGTRQPGEGPPRRALSVGAVIGREGLSAEPFRLCQLRKMVSFALNHPAHNLLRGRPVAQAHAAHAEDAWHGSKCACSPMQAHAQHSVSIGGAGPGQPPLRALICSSNMQASQQGMEERDHSETIPQQKNSFVSPSPLGRMRAHPGGKSRTKKKAGGSKKNSRRLSRLTEASALKASTVAAGSTTPPAAEASAASVSEVRLRCETWSRSTWASLHTTGGSGSLQSTRAFSLSLYLSPPAAGEGTP